MIELKINTVEINKITENIRKISKSIEENINPVTSNIQEISDVIQKVTSSMNEIVESINLQLDPIKECIEEYNKSMQVFIKSINSIKETFGNITLNSSIITYKNNNVDEDIVNKYENTILDTQDTSSKRFIIIDIFSSIGKEIIKHKENNTLLEKIILPLIRIILTIISSIIFQPNSNAPEIIYILWFQIYSK